MFDNVFCENGTYPLIRREGDIQHGVFEINDAGYHVKFSDAQFDRGLREEINQSELFQFSVIIDFKEYFVTLVGIYEFSAQTRIIADGQVQSHTNITFKNAYISADSAPDFNAHIASGNLELRFPNGVRKQTQLPSHEMLRGASDCFGRGFHYNNLKCVFVLLNNDSYEWNRFIREIRYGIQFTLKQEVEAVQVFKDLSAITKLLSLAFGEPVLNGRVVLYSLTGQMMLMLPVKDPLSDGSRDHLATSMHSVDFSVLDEDSLTILFNVFQDVEKHVNGFAAQVFDIRFSVGRPQYRFLIACGLFEQFFKQSEVLGLAGGSLPHFKKQINALSGKLHPAKTMDKVFFADAWEIVEIFHGESELELWPHDLKEIKDLRNSFAHGGDPGPYDIRKINRFSWMLADTVATFCSQIYAARLVP